MRQKLYYAFLVVFLVLVSACGTGTDVKIINNTSNDSFGLVTVKSRTDSTVFVEFEQVIKGAETDTEGWPDNEALTILIETQTPNTTDVTEAAKAVTLSVEKTNVITLKDGPSADQILYTLEVQTEDTE